MLGQILSFIFMRSSSGLKTLRKNYAVEKKIMKIEKYPYFDDFDDF